MTRLWIAGGATAIMLLLLATAAHAGGWATVTLDRPLSEPRAGEMIEVGFLVKQHDKTPIHQVSGQALEPVFIARHQESGERIESRATPAKAIGHFVAQVRFPQAGTWFPEIVPAPFAGTRLEPVTVLSSTGTRTTTTASDEATLTQMTAPAPHEASTGGFTDTVGAIGLVSIVVIVAGVALIGGRRVIGRSA
ncbi:MAG: hypothetical protein AB7R89_32015 [Dehalococcoidia bacterium]